MKTRSSFCDFINHKFFEQGAFLTNPENQEITFARGGKTQKIISTPEQTCFYLKDFYQDTFIGYFPEETLTLPHSVVKEWLEEKTEINLSFMSVENEDKYYTEDFKKLKNSFGEELKKVVLVSCEKFTLQDASAAKRHFFTQALNYGTGLPYGFWGNGYGIVGSSPEVLFSLENLKLKTFALAGTAPLQNGEQLLNSHKDRTEHNLVITDISEKLRPFSADVKIDKTCLHPYRNIVHLKTNIECQLKKPGNPLELAALLSPTAALGGYPQSSAINFLSQTQYAKRHPQRFFGSAMGLHTPDANFAIVMIRNIQWHGDIFSIESGGGVVPESELESEMQEIHLKRESIKGHYL